MRCLNCQVENNAEARQCVNCAVTFVPIHAQRYLELAEVALNQGNFELASAHLANADREMLGLAVAQRDEYLLTPRAFHLQAMIYYNKGMMNLAREELLSALQVLERLPQGKAMLADILNLLGNVSYYLYNIDESLVFYQRCIDIAIEAGAYVVAAKGYGNLASHYFEHNDYDKAIELYRQGMAQSELSGDPTSLAQSYRVLAPLYAHCGPMPLALDYATKSLALREQVPNVEIRSLLTSQAATVYAIAGDINRAAQYLRESYRLAQQSNSELAREGVAVGVSELLRQGGAHEPWFAVAMKVFKDATGSTMQRGEATLRLAIYYISRGNEGHIRRHLYWVKENLLGTSEIEDAAAIDQAYGLLYKALGEDEVAEVHFKLALDGGKLYPFDEAIILQEYGTMLLARAEDQNDPDTSREGRYALERAATLFRQIELPHRLAAVEARLGAIRPPVSTYHAEASASLGLADLATIARLM